MRSIFPAGGFLNIPVSIACMLAFAQVGTAVGDANKQRDNAPLVRFICTSILDDEEQDQEVVLASHDADGEWVEHATLTLRTSYISAWLPVVTGELHLALREADGLRSIGHFTSPEAARRTLVILIADPMNEVYKLEVIDPEKLEFVKGTTLIVNFSEQTALVHLGATEITVEAGAQMVASPAIEENGMYRKTVSHHDSDENMVLSFDTYVPGNPNARDMLFLFHGPAPGFQVMSLTEFGPFE